MSELQDLFNRNIASIKLKILIFGPDPNGPTDNPRVTALRDKRIEIRNHLITSGHTAAFPEDIIDPNAPPPINNSALAETLLMKEYDAIVALVETPGSIAEAGLISGRRDIAIKSLLFICDEYTSGFPYQVCKLAEDIGGVLNTFCYPTDLTDCHLLTMVNTMVLKIQRAKYFS